MRWRSWETKSGKWMPGLGVMLAVLAGAPAAGSAVATLIFLLQSIGD